MLDAIARRLFSPLCAACAFLLIAASPAGAQPVSYDPADFGKAQLPVRQSTGDAAARIAANAGGAFEPINELDAADPLARLARPIGRVDVLLRSVSSGTETATSCTGALVAGGYVITNHHCLPQEGDLRPVEASILMDYLTLNGEGAARFALEPTPVEWDAALDFALTRVEGAPQETFGVVAIGQGEGASASRTIIHHPLGRPKVMSRFRCMVLDVAGEPALVAHRCDTLPGSSGALMFDVRRLAIALHREGGLDPADGSSFNTATDMAAILQRSRILSAKPSATVAAPATTQPAPSGALSPGDMNAILRSGAGEGQKPF